MNNNIKQMRQAGIQNGLRWNFVIRIDEDETWYAEIFVGDKTMTAYATTFERCWDEAFMRTMEMVEKMSGER